MFVSPAEKDREWHVPHVTTPNSNKTILKYREFLRGCFISLLPSAYFPRRLQNGAQRYRVRGAEEKKADLQGIAHPSPLFSDSSHLSRWAGGFLIAPQPAWRTHPNTPEDVVRSHLLYLHGTGWTRKLTTRLKVECYLPRAWCCSLTHPPGKGNQFLVVGKLQKAKALQSQRDFFYWHHGETRCNDVIMCKCYNRWISKGKPSSYWTGCKCSEKTLTCSQKLLLNFWSGVIFRSMSQTHLTRWRQQYKVHSHLH